VQITFLGGVIDLRAPGGAWDLATPGRQGFENGVEMPDDFWLAAGGC
jgi:hypothetical protein